MIIKQLQLTGVRGLEHATLTFEPGMNLVVGVNGAGKSTVIDALRTLLSQAVPKATDIRLGALGFGNEDIKDDRDALSAQIVFNIWKVDFTYFVRKSRKSGLGRVSRRAARHGAVSEISDISGFVRPALRVSREPTKSLPLVIYFSPRRSLASTTDPSRRTRQSNVELAFAEALSYRELRISEIAEWWFSRQKLEREQKTPRSKRISEALRIALLQFLDGCGEVKPVRLQGEATIQVAKDGALLNVRQLSDGERNVLSLILDLARRLALAYPGLRNPLSEGSAVVLIDELELHMHPVWQREIVARLEQTFPKCQFIATTHSPQIVGEVPATKIILLQPGHSPVRPMQSLGKDSNWVLERLMGTPKRNRALDERIRRVFEFIDKGRYRAAKNAIAEVRCEMGDDAELVKASVAIDRIEALGK